MLSCILQSQGAQHFESVRPVKVTSVQAASSLSLYAFGRPTELCFMQVPDIAAIVHHLQNMPDEVITDKLSRMKYLQKSMSYTVRAAAS